MSSRILIYSGSGSARFSVEGLFRQVKEICDDRLYQIDTLDGFEALLGIMHTVKMIVVPGGNAAEMFINTGFMEERTATLFKEIFTASRVHYYGVCAGALLAATGYYSRIKEGLHHGRRSTFLDLVPVEALAPIGTGARGEVIGFKHIQMLPHRTRTASTVLAAHILHPGFLNRSRFACLTTLSDFDRSYSTEYAYSVSGICEVVPSGHVVEERLDQSLLYIPEASGAALLTSSHLELDSTVVGSGTFKSDFYLTAREQEVLKSQLAPGDCERLEIVRSSFLRMGLACKA